MKKLVAIPVILFFCMNTGAASSPPATGVYGHVIATATGVAGEAFYLDLDVTINASCQDQIRASIAPTLAQYKESVSEAMYALSSGRQVLVYYSGCVPNNAAAAFLAIEVTNHY
jgi:hypothetical protein